MKDGRRTIRTISSEIQRTAQDAAHDAEATLSTNDGRWAILSTLLTAVIAGGVALLSTGISPSNYAEPARAHALLPYKLFLNLTRSEKSVASLGPLGALRTDTELSGTNADNANQTPGIDKRNVTLESGDTLTATLTESGLTSDDAVAIVGALSDKFDPRGLRAGQNIELTFAPAPNGDPAAARIIAMRFSPSIEQDVSVVRSADGSFSADLVQKKLTAHVHRAGATIDSSLYLAAMQAGIPADVVVEMIRMFSYKVDFQRDIHPGDSFEVFYDYYYTPEGQPAKAGNISFASMKLGGNDIVLYRHQSDPDGEADYFDAKGQSAKGLLMKTPVDGARISSGFGMRFHPVLGYSRMHKGVDFAVPIGTPVMAAGAGTVAFVGIQNGYGKFVMINHGNGYSTAYGHLSRFAAGLHIGSRVRQGQIVANSGMTGIATGPHLHYEIRINKNQVNPLTVKFAQGRTLTGGELRRFLEARLKLDTQMAATKLETKVADLSADLRQAKGK